jgi:hypothetical protein
MASRGIPVSVRFWSKTKTDGDCIVWTGPIDKGGYGRVWFNQKSGYAAHRAAYVLTHGDIPAGLGILHTCDNRKCVNPEHLYAGTAKDNMRDCIDRKRTAAGESHGMAKLSADNIVEIRRLIVCGERLVDIAERFSVSPSTVTGINRGDNWSSVESGGFIRRKSRKTLTPAMVIEIRRLLALCTLTQTQIAVKFGVSLQAVHGIKSGRTWKSVPTESDWHLAAQEPA